MTTTWQIRLSVKVWIFVVRPPRERPIDGRSFGRQSRVTRRCPLCPGRGSPDPGRRPMICGRPRRVGGLGRRSSPPTATARDRDQRSVGASPPDVPRGRFVGRCRPVTSGNGVPRWSAMRRTRPVGPARVSRAVPPRDALQRSSMICPWASRTTLGGRQYRLHNGPEPVLDHPIAHHSRIITDDPAECPVSGRDERVAGGDE